MIYLSRPCPAGGEHVSGTQGFTLIELVIVLAILAMASSVVTFSVARVRDKAVLREEAGILRSTLAHARRLSLMERVPVSLSLDMESGVYVVLRDGKPTDMKRTMDHRLTVAGSDEIVFFPKGDSTGGYIKLSDSRQRTYTIEVDNVTGSAKLRRI